MTTGADAGPDGLTQFSDPVVAEAHDRWQSVSEYESLWRARFIEDIKFRHGDSDNQYQWPNNMRMAREGAQKPVLTINIVRQHNNQIVNDAKQNKTSARVRATGGGATKLAADVWEAIVRRIEERSGAQAIYGNAVEWQVDGGYGAWRIVTDYAGDDTFNQEILLDPIIDPLCIYDDPDCKQRDKSDRKFLFYFDMLPNEVFKKTYPKWKHLAGTVPLGVSATGDGRVPREHTIIAEYWRITESKDELIEFWDERSRQPILARRSRLPKNVWESISKSENLRFREVNSPQVERKIIVGSEIVEEGEWPGKYIPFVVILGEETRIGGAVDRKGHTRALKDAQRMYNYHSSSQVEFTALQGKTPWIISSKGITEYEHLWNTANIANHSVLVWNDEGENGEKIQPPFRAQPPVPSQAYQAGMDTAFNQLMMASGQWQNEMGMMGNERTGEAIKQRKHQSDRAVFHFQDNFELGLKFTARQFIDLIPRIYDTKQVMMLTSESGEEFEALLDPASAKPFTQVTDVEGQVIRRVLNPRLGEYDVVPSSGAAYGTRREETVEALTLILTQNPGLTGIVGDLLLSAMDFKEAQEAAQRLKRMIPPQALGKGPTQQEQALQQQLSQAQQLLAKALEKHGKDALKLAGKSEMRDIDAYEAETKRFAALKDELPGDAEGLQKVIDQLVTDSLATQLQPILEANKDDIEDSPDNGNGSAQHSQVAKVLGGRQAPDGDWYLSDPTRRGRFLRIAPLAQQRREPSGGASR